MSASSSIMKQDSESTHMATAGPEEIPIKKPLPCRQHADKPILQYDGRPPQFYSQSHTALFSHSHSNPGLSGSPTKCMSSNGFTCVGYASSQDRVRNGSSRTVHSISALAKGDFGDLLSAKEVVRDSISEQRFQQLQLYRVGPSMPLVPPSSAMCRSHTLDALDSGPDDLPGIMYYNSLSTQITPKKREHSALSQSASDLTDCRLQVKKEGQFVAFSQAFPQVTSAGITLSPPPKGSCVREKQQATPSYFSRMQTAPVLDADMDWSSGQTSENIEQSKKHRSDVTAGKGIKPLSSSASFNSSQSIKSPSRGRPVTNIRGNGLVVSGGDMASVGETGLLQRNLTASQLLNTRMSMLCKVPGSLYFRKSLLDQGCRKAAVSSFIPEHRSSDEGAPARQPSLHSEKILMVAGVEMDDEDDDDDDTSMPSGERLLGDGEASDYDELGTEDDDDDDVGIDNLCDECQNDDGEDSNKSQASTTPLRFPSATSQPSTLQSSRCPSSVVGEIQTPSTAVQPVTSSGETVVQPALRPSLFPAVPPTINFVLDGQKVEQLPWEIRKLLKWRMCSITPNVVKAVLRRSNFRITKKNNDWLGFFGKHMKAVAFKSIREYQKVNHFPGSFQLGRKDRLWRNLSRMQVSFGKKQFGFFPQTYILPQDMRHLQRAWEDASTKQKWIIKPPASARGIGIKVINKWSQIPRRQPVIVQKYLSKPLLINNSKFDMRVYVYISCFDPLRIYIFEDGLARFASCKYSSSMKNLGNRFMHLTNYSVNKRNADYQTNTDDKVCQGHKWSLKSLWSYLQNEGVDTVRLWDNIKDIVVKTIISGDAPINRMTKANLCSRYCVHELFGFDILLDEQLKPWILEVNISPSLHSSSALDVSVKSRMVCDMMNLAGFRVPDKNDIINSAHSASTIPDLSAHIPSSNYCIDKRLFSSQLTADEQAKQAYFCQKWQDEQVLQSMLDVLTPDDVRVLTESMDEESRRGGFICVFPTPSTKRYLRFFEQPRYYNLLLDQWVTQYNCMEQRGISILQSMCEDGIHLENPTSNLSHQWCAHNSSGPMLVSARDTQNVPPHKKDTAQRTGQFRQRLPKVKTGTDGEGPSVVCPKW